MTAAEMPGFSGFNRHWVNSMDQSGPFLRYFPPSSALPADARIEIQRLAALAWVTFSRGRQDDGLALMQQAAALEATTEKAPVTPGELLPAAELLGDMLLDMGRFDDAIAAYDTALARSPGRFNSLYGAGQASERMEDKERAGEYYGRLVQRTAEAGDSRPRLAHARDVVVP